MVGQGLGHPWGWATGQVGAPCPAPARTPPAAAPEDGPVSFPSCFCGRSPARRCVQRPGARSCLPGPSSPTHHRPRGPPQPRKEAEQAGPVPLPGQGSTRTAVAQAVGLGPGAERTGCGRSPHLGRSLLHLPSPHETLRWGWWQARPRPEGWGARVGVGSDSGGPSLPGTGGPSPSVLGKCYFPKTGNFILFFSTCNIL